MGKTAYPEVLQKAKWDKEKGLIAKLVKAETGVGAMLDDLKKSYDTIPWEKLDDAALSKTATPEAAAKALADGRAVLNGQIESTRKKAMEANKLGTKVAGELKKSPLSPKSTREFLEKMATAATNFSVALRDEAIETLKKYEDSGKKAVTEQVEIQKQIDELVKARKAAAGIIAAALKEFLVYQKQAETSLKTAEDAAQQAVTLGKTEPGKAAVSAKQARAAADSLAKLVEKAKPEYEKLQGNATVGTARLGNTDTRVSKPAAVLSGSEWTKGSADFEAINKICGGLKQASDKAETAANKAESAAGTSTKSGGDYVKIADEVTTALVGLLKDAQLAYTRLQGGPSTLDEAIKTAQADKASIPNAKKAAQLRTTDGNKQITRLGELFKSVDTLSGKLSGIPGTYKTDPKVVAAEKKIKEVKNYIGAAQASAPAILKQIETRSTAIAAMK